MTDNRTIRRIDRKVRRVFVEGFVYNHVTADRVIPPAVVLFVRGVGAEVSVCPAEENENFVLNPLYEDNNDGEVHLSAASCGALVRARGTSLEKACEQYNREHSFTASVVDGAQFSQIILIRREDYIKKFNL